MNIKPELIQILAVDDDPKIHAIMTRLLRRASGYSLTLASSGDEALSLLRQNTFDSVLLDRMMPGMDGLTLLQKIKEDASLAHIPVILQTAMGQTYDVKEGVKNGAFYYITKPMPPKNEFFAIVNAAVDDNRRFLFIREALKAKISDLPVSGKTIYFRTQEEARDLAILLSRLCPNSETVALVLTELLLNAIEHGNLGVHCEEKKAMLLNGTWHVEIKQRFALLENLDKKATISFTITDHKIQFLIKDEGRGFDWSDFLTIKNERAIYPNARGIAMSCSFNAGLIEYSGNGNTVLFTVAK